MARGTKGLEEARAAKGKALRVFRKLAPVCGAGITRARGVYAVKVNLETQPDSQVELPDEIDGVPVVLSVVGKIRKQAHAGGG